MKTAIFLLNDSELLSVQAQGFPGQVRWDPRVVGPRGENTKGDPDPHEAT